MADKVAPYGLSGVITGDRPPSRVPALPDVLTDEQMEKLGGKDVPNEMTDEEMQAAEKPPNARLDPDLYEKAAKLDRIGQAARDYRKNVGEINVLRQGTGPALSGNELPNDPHEQPLIREDPAMTAATMMAGGAAGKLAARGIGMGAKGAIGGLARLSPVLADLAEPGIAAGTTSALQGGNLKDNLKSAAIGTALGIPGAAVGVLRRAPEAVDERITQAVTGGLKSKAAKQVVAGGAVNDVLDAHPDLKRVIAGAGDPVTKFNATSATMAKLSAANDAVYDAIQAQHGGVPIQGITDKIEAVAEKAHAAGDADLEKAAEAAIENVKRYGAARDKGVVATATQIRGIRNNMAKRVQAVNPTLGPTDVQAASDEIKRAINDGIEEVAAKTKGVDIAALRERNKQLAVLMPVQRTLREQAIAKGLKEGEDPLAEILKPHGLQHAVAGLANAAPAKADLFLSNRPLGQDFAHGPPGSFLSSLSTTAPLAGTAVNRKVPQSELEYAAKVSQGIKDGLSLQAAVKAAGER